MKLYEVIYSKEYFDDTDELDEYAFIGVYDSKKRAKKVLKKMQNKRKFKKNKKDIWIQKIIVDPKKTPWEGGFVQGD